LTPTPGLNPSENLEAVSRSKQAGMKTAVHLPRRLGEPLRANIATQIAWGRGGMNKTWFEQFQERRATTQKKQQSTLTAEQIGRYAHEVRREIQDLIQVRRRERLAEEENAGFLEVTGEQAMADQDLKWPPGSDRHPFQRVAALSLKIAGRNQGLRFRLLKLFCEEAERGTCAAAIYEAVWDTISNLADDVLDEAIGVVYEEPKAKAASAA
jgi:hypothetical protein